MCKVWEFNHKFNLKIVLCGGVSFQIEWKSYYGPRFIHRLIREVRWNRFNPILLKTFIGIKSNQHDHIFLLKSCQS